MLTAEEVRRLVVWKWHYASGGSLSRQEVARLLFVKWLIRNGRLVA